MAVEPQRVLVNQATFVHHAPPVARVAHRLPAAQRVLGPAGAIVMPKRVPLGLVETEIPPAHVVEPQVAAAAAAAGMVVVVVALVLAVGGAVISLGQPTVLTAAT